MELGTRMKGYEGVSKNFLIKRMPVIIRLDGRSFSTFTKGLEKPFDEILMKAMWETSKVVAKRIEGCKVVYTQSDEISLLLTDYTNINTYAWFEYNVQKIVSSSASIATLAFNIAFNNIYQEYLSKELISEDMIQTYESKLFKAEFDSRAYNIPKEEVVNYFIWRQQDAMKNSVQMVARATLGHKKIQNKNGKQMQELLLCVGLDFDKIPTPQKRGVCVEKVKYMLDNEEKTKRTRWDVDENIPVFTEDREYIERFI